MPSLLDFPPLFQETSETIRARLDADLNAGLTPDDPRRIDTREGSFYFDVTQVCVLELARLWDALATDVPASAFPLFAWGTYLDDHATAFGLTRKAAVSALGVVRFAGDPGVTVQTGTIVSAEVQGVEGPETIEFATTQDAVTGAQVARPGTPAITPANAGGILTTGTYYYRVSAYTALGETNGSDEVSGAIVGTTGRVTLDWPDVAGAAGYRVYRSAIAGGPYTLVADIAGAGNSSFIDNGGQPPGIVGPPTENTTAAVDVPVSAVEPGSVGNVGAASVASLESSNPGIDVVTNPAAMAGGTDEETDAALRDRIMIQYAGQGAGNIVDYKRWSLEEPGVGRVSVIPAGLGPGTVQVVVMTASGDPVAPATVASLQNRLDPVAGQGAGLAPIGASVTVQTPTAVPINIVATVTHAAGYNLDGTGGLIGTRVGIQNALSEYIDALDVGDSVVYNHVVAQFFRVKGVLNVTGVTINGATADVVISATPPQVAQTGSVTLA